MIPLLAILVALGCCIASARRLWLAANPTAIHPEELLLALGPTPDAESLAALRALVANHPRADWERDLLAALEAPVAEQRVALVNEQLGELDHRIQQWVRVPRVCASVAASVAFLLGTLVLRRGLSDAADLTGDVGELLVRGLVGDAFTVVAFGFVGTSFSIAAQTHARRFATARAEAADRLVDVLERAAADFPSP